MQAVDFQRAQFVSTYVVNLAWHYTFIPGLFHFELRPPNELMFLDFGLRNRIQAFYRPPRRELWLPCDVDEQEMAAGLKRQARFALRALDRFGRKWPDPRLFLHALAPDVIQKTKATGIADPIEKAIWNVLPEWEPFGNFDVLYMLCAIAMREAMPGLARQYAHLAIEDGCSKRGSVAISRLVDGD